MWDRWHNNKVLETVHAAKIGYWHEGTQYPCTSVGDHGRNAMVWLSDYMVVHDNIWQCMAMHRWVTMAMHKCTDVHEGTQYPCTSVGDHELNVMVLLSDCMVVHDNAWQCMAMHDSTWQCMTTHGLFSCSG